MQNKDKKEKKVEEWRGLEANERLKHALIKGIVEFIDKSVTVKLLQESNTWDEDSRIMVTASELEVQIPHLINLANQKLEHHMGYLKKGK